MAPATIAIDSQQRGGGPPDILPPHKVYVSVIILDI